jgi:hypothetical protein
MTTAASYTDYPGYFWLGAVFFVLVLAPLVAIAIRGSWRDEPRWREPPPWWVGGRAQFYGLVRATPSCLLALAAGFAALPVLDLLDKDSTLFKVLVLLLVALMLAGAVLAVTTFLIGRPHFIVPPPRRADPSAITEAIRYFLPGRRRRRES